MLPLLAQLRRSSGSGGGVGSVALNVVSRARARRGYLERAFAAAPPQVVAAAAAAAPVYGAPFTNSIAFAPSPPPPASPSPSAAAPAAAAAAAYTLRLRVPGLGQGDVQLAPGASLADVVVDVARVTGAARVRWCCNGRALPDAALATTRLADVFGASAELELDGLRYSVNGGLLLTAAGSAPRRPAAVSYALVAAGGGAVVVGCFSFWHWYLDTRHNKIKQLLR